MKYRMLKVFVGFLFVCGAITSEAGDYCANNWSASIAKSEDTRKMITEIAAVYNNADLTKLLRVLGVEAPAQSEAVNTIGLLQNLGEIKSAAVQQEIESVR